MVQRMALFFFANGNPKAAATCGDFFFFFLNVDRHKIHVISIFAAAVIAAVAAKPDTLYDGAASLAWVIKRWLYQNGKAVITVF
jgi:hypothetical protein